MIISPSTSKRAASLALIWKTTGPASSMRTQVSQRTENLSGGISSSGASLSQS